MYEWLFAGLIVFLASALQASTGFGFAIMATPFLLMIFDSRDCIQLSIFLSLFIALVLTPKLKQQIDHSLLKRLIQGSIWGAPIGIVFFAFVSLEILKAAVSVAILVIGSFLLYQWYQYYYPRAEKTKEITEVDALEIKRRQENNCVKGQKSEFLVGLLSGALTTSLGMPGVPLAIYFSARNIKKEVIRSTTLAFFIVVYLFSILLQVFTVDISVDVLRLTLYLIPTAAAGIFLGNMMFQKLDQRKFQLIVNLILLYTGLHLFYKTMLA